MIQLQFWGFYVLGIAVTIVGKLRGFYSGVHIIFCLLYRFFALEGFLSFVWGGGGEGGGMLLLQRPKTALLQFKLANNKRSASRLNTQYGQENAVLFSLATDF